MNILELDSYNLADAVKFNNELNPKIWEGNTMKPEVRAKLLAVAEDFKEFLGLSDVNVKDITVSGSNANYSYTPYSDIDLHLVVDIPRADEDEVYRELFDAKKYQYNDLHDIKIGGYDVELYVENANKPPVSKGVYSVLHNDWVNIPRKIRSAVDDDAVRSKYEDIKHRIDSAVSGGNAETISTLAEKIKSMRQAGLAEHGELGPENLAYKMLRTQGKIKELYDARNSAQDQELSLKERKKPDSVFTYGFKHKESVQPTVVEETPKVETNPTDEEILKDFIDFCVKELKIKTIPTIKLRRDPQWSVRNKTFGRYINDQHLLEVAWGHRHIMDVLRTVAHELTHRHQHERDGERMGPSAGETGSPWENEANARAGILMRDYGRLHPELFDAGETELEESASGYIPTKKQAKDPRWSMALTQDIRPGQLGREANKLKLKTNKQGVPQVANPNGLFEKLALELTQFKKKGTLAESDEQLDEVRMAPSNLMQWAKSPAAQGVRAGFEAELIFRDTASGDDDDYEMEPDYDADERCRSLDQVVDFFESGDYGNMSPRQADRLREQLDETYYEWYDEQMHKDFSNEAEDLIRKVMVDEGDWDLDNEIQKQLDLLGLSNDEINDIVNAGERAPKFTSTKEQQAYAEANPLYQKYLDAQEEAEGLLDDLIEDEVRKQGPNWDAALDDFRDNYQIDDDSGFFDDVGMRWMSDVANNYDLDWPYMTGGGGNDGSRSWEEIGDSLNGVVDMPVKVSSNYHSTTRREGVWIVEPDSSLEPDDREDFGLEIVSPPMPLLTALEKLQEVTDWANSPEGNAYTNSSTGLHMGVSVPFKGGDVDYLKLILFLGDEYVLQQFGREANTYCKSAMSKFRENIKGGRSDPMSVIKLMQHGLLELAHKELQKGVGEGKYTSAHIQKGYIEFRSAGGDWLAEENADPEILQNTMLRYARAMSLAANPAEERREYAKKLYKLVAPEGDSQLALFSQFAAGELDKEQLKKRWAEKIIGTEKKMNQRWKLYRNENGVWTTVPGAEWNGYSEDQVKTAVWSKYGREALDSGEYQLVNMGEQDWEVYDVNTGKTLEIVKGKSKGEVADAVYDKYAEKGIGFNVRPYVDPKTLTPRAKLAKRIAEPKQKGDWDVVYKPTGRVIDNILRVDRDQAQKLLAQVAVLHDFENADNLEIRPQQAEQPKPAQATAPNGVPVWELVDRMSGTVLHTFADHTFREAWPQARTWLSSYGAEDPDTYGVRFEVRPKMNASTPIGRSPARDTGVQDVEPDVAQNFAPQDATEVPRNWEYVDRITGRVVDTVSNASYNQANTVQADIERRYPAADIYLRSVSPRPELEENFADGRGPGRPGDSVRYGIPKGATMAELERASHDSGRKGQLARWQLNMRRGKARAK